MLYIMFINYIDMGCCMHDSSRIAQICFHVMKLINSRVEMYS